MGMCWEWFRSRARDSMDRLPATILAATISSRWKRQRPSSQPWILCNRKRDQYCRADYLVEGFGFDPDVLLAPGFLLVVLLHPRFEALARRGVFARECERSNIAVRNRESSRLVF